MLLKLVHGLGQVMYIHNILKLENALHYQYSKYSVNLLKETSKFLFLLDMDVAAIVQAIFLD